MNRPRLCLVEDDSIMGESLCDRFQLEQFDVTWHRCGEDAITDVNDGRYALVISDIRLPDMSGDELFVSLQDQNEALPPFIFITGYGSVEKAVNLIKRGAVDYITKPFDLDELMEKVQAVVQQLHPHTDEQDTSLGISLAMRNMEASIPRIAKSNTSVLITGESGVGKEHVARRIHDCAHVDGAGRFVAVNCGALSASLLEAELFGYEKGAFTGAARTKKGVFELANGGTLFLDEIGDMPLDMQVHLLRVVQEKTVIRVGGEMEIPVHVRLIFATNRNLKKLVEKGQFREDLFYRINVIHLHVPPLRERKEDILWFSKRFLSELCAERGQEPRFIDRSAEKAMLEYLWPGNLRELRHCIERACILRDQKYLPAAALLEPLIAADTHADVGGEVTAENLNEHLRHCERSFIWDALEQHDWHILETANALGISRKNLWEKMRKLNISNSSG